MRRLVILVPVLACLACGPDDEEGAVGLDAVDGGDAQSSVTSDGGGSTDAATAGTDATVDGGAADAKIDATPPVVFTGEATYYDANGPNACGVALPSDLLVAAMNKAQYKKSLCGQCVRVKGPKGEVTVRIVDLCPGCAMGDVDLSEEAFLAISPLSAGRVKITWSFVACP